MDRRREQIMLQMLQRLADVDPAFAGTIHDQLGEVGWRIEPRLWKLCSERRL
jgi:hypothetical protein